MFQTQETWLSVVSLCGRNASVQNPYYQTACNILSRVGCNENPRPTREDGSVFDRR